MVKQNSPEKMNILNPPATQAPEPKKSSPAFLDMGLDDTPKSPPKKVAPVEQVTKSPDADPFARDVLPPPAKPEIFSRPEKKIEPIHGSELFKSPEKDTQAAGITLGSPEVEAPVACIETSSEKKVKKAKKPKEKKEKKKKKSEKKDGPLYDLPDLQQKRAPNGLAAFAEMHGGADNGLGLPGIGGQKMQFDVPDYSNVEFDKKQDPYAGMSFQEIMKAK